METTVRFVVQIKISDGEWQTYRASRRSKGYSLTAAESFAYVKTLPATLKVWQKSQTVKIAVDAPAVYRVIRSECTDGLITQTIASE